MEIEIRLIPSKALSSWICSKEILLAKNDLEAKREYTCLEHNTMDLSCECLTSFKNYLIPNQTPRFWMSDKSMLRIPVRDKSIEAFHSENKSSKTFTTLSVKGSRQLRRRI